MGNTSLYDVVYGTNASEVIFGWNYNDTLYGGGGSDILWGSTGNDINYGGAGSDTYQWRKNDPWYSGNNGIDTILDTASTPSDTDTLNLSDLNRSEVTLARSGNNLVITVTSGGSITILGQFAGGVGGTGIEQFVFQDQTVLHSDLADLVKIGGGNTSVNLSGSGDRDILTGSTVSDTLTGNDGDDTITGGSGSDSLKGGNGSDSYVWSRYDGTDTLDDSGTSVIEIDCLDLHGVTQDKVLLSRVGPNLVITILSSNGVLTDGGDITVSNRFVNTTDGRGLELIRFDDGSAWSLFDIESRATSTSLTGTAYADVISGSAGNDTPIGNAGSDTLTSGAGDDLLQGGEGSDTYYWGIGENSDRLDDSGVKLTEADRLILTNISSQDYLDGKLTLFRQYTDSTVQGGSDSISGDLTLRYFVNGSVDVSLIVANQFSSLTSGKGIETIQFSDGVIWNLLDITNRTKINMSGTLVNVVSGTAFAENLGHL